MHVLKTSGVVRKRVQKKGSNYNTIKLCYLIKLFPVIDYVINSNTNDTKVHTAKVTVKHVNPVFGKRLVEKAFSNFLTFKSDLIKSRRLEED